MLMQTGDAKPTRVSLFLPSLRGGGAERVMVNLARGFVDRGLDVDLVLVKAEGPYLAEVPPGVRVVNLKASRVLASLPGLMRYLRREKPAALLSTLDHANIVALWAKRLSRSPTRVVIRVANNIIHSSDHASTTRARFTPRLIQLFCPWADVIVAVSKGVAEDLARITGIPSAHIRVIYSPVVTPELFQRAKEPVEHPWFASGQPPVILGVGRLTKQKDLPTLIRAFALVRRERPARLLVLGEGEERPRLEALVKELGLEDEVALPGFVENPYAYMSRAAVFVLSSAWEGLPNVLIQAMACGCPVVSTDCPNGPAEILENGRYGLLVPVGDVETLAQAVNGTLAKPRRPEVAARAADFGLNQAVHNYLDVLLKGSNLHFGEDLI